MYLTVPERIKQVNDKVDEQERIECLRKHINTYPQIKDLLYLAYAPLLVMDLPETTPPYKVNDVPPEYAGSNLIKEHRRMVHFIPGMSGVKAMKKEMMFIQILEAMCKIEAEFLLQIKDKTLQDVYPNLSVEFMQKYFPEFYVIAGQE